MTLYYHAELLPSMQPLYGPSDGHLPAIETSTPQEEGAGLVMGRLSKKRQVDEDDTGYYTCEARASIGSWMDTVRVKVDKDNNDDSEVIMILGIFFGVPISIAVIVSCIVVQFLLRRELKKTHGQTQG